MRAAVETEEHLENPRLASAGLEYPDADRLASLRTTPRAPTEEELLDYAVALGRRADELVDLARSISAAGYPGGPAAALPR